MNYPIATWQRSAFEKIEYVFNLDVDNKWNEVFDIIEDMDSAYNSVLEKTGSLQDTSNEALSYGSYLIWHYLSIKSIHALRSVNCEITKASILNTLISKQRDYGKDNIVKFGSAGLLIRMQDKLSRLQNLLNKSNYNFNAALSVNAVPGESVIDTFIDIIGYSIIGIMWCSIDEETGEREFMLPLI